MTGEIKLGNIYLQRGRCAHLRKPPVKPDHSGSRTCSGHCLQTDFSRKWKQLPFLKVVNTKLAFRLNNENLEPHMFRNDMPIGKSSMGHKYQYFPKVSVSTFCHNLFFPCWPEKLSWNPCRQCSVFSVSVLSLKIVSFLFINIHNCMYFYHMLFIFEINQYFLTSKTFLFTKNKCHSLCSKYNTV